MVQNAQIWSPCLLSRHVSFIHSFQLMVLLIVAKLATNEALDLPITVTRSRSLQKRETQGGLIVRLASAFAISLLPFILNILGLPATLLVALASAFGYFVAYDVDHQYASQLLSTKSAEDFLYAAIPSVYQPTAEPLKQSAPVCGGRFGGSGIPSDPVTDPDNEPVGIFAFGGACGGFGGRR